MKKIIKLILLKISRIIFQLIPTEFSQETKLKNRIRLEQKQKLRLRLEEDLIEETLIHFKKHFKKSVLFTDSSEIRKYAISSSLTNDRDKKMYYLEFGTWKGQSANFFSKYVHKLYCFDSFEGLKEDWVGKSWPKGHFNLNKKVPELNSNVETVVGWVEDTLEEFLKRHNPKINFVHMDMDTYSPTKFTLEKLKPYLEKDSIILFDELYNYYGWENGEYKALNEVFKENEFEYKAFHICEKKCVIRVK
jgi:hypothetical protein